MNGISYKTLSGPNPLRIRFNKVGGFIRNNDGTRYLQLLGSEKYDDIYNRIRYQFHICFFLTITRKSKLIFMILYLWKKHRIFVML